MRVRCHWLRARIDRGLLRTIGEAMLTREYGRRRSAGFRVEETRRDYIRGTYLERVEWDDVLEDPATGTLKLHRLEIRRLRFRLSVDGPEIEMVNPPRSARPFLSALQECAGTGLAVMQIAVRPPMWLEVLEPEMTRPRVLAMSTEPLTLGASTAAIVRIEGTADVRADLIKLLPRDSVEANRLDVAWESRSGMARCELLAQGRALITSGSAEDVITFLRQGLSRALKVSAVRRDEV